MSAETSAATTRPVWIRALPVLILLVAIAAQATLMSTSNADRQAGSGFAMFSSVDFAGSRAVVVTASHDGTQIDVQLPHSTANRVDELLRSPTDARAGALAVELGKLAWRLDDGTFVIDDNGSAVDGLSVTVRGLTADGRQLGSQILAVAVTP